MTPESLDEYLAAFGEKVCMKGKSGGKMVAVSQLREYVRRAIAVAESRCNGPLTANQKGTEPCDNE